MGAGFLCMGEEYLCWCEISLKIRSNTTDWKSKGTRRCNPKLVSVTLRCWTGKWEDISYHLEVTFLERTRSLGRVTMD